MHPQPILLYADAIDHLIYNAQGGDSNKEVRDLRQAIQNAYNEVVYETDWKYYWRQGQVLLAAPYSTGTVVYDHTGGSSERLVTLSGGTFPSWARYGRIKIGDVVYPVATNPSGTTLTLSEDINPGADVGSGSYIMFQSEYSLPTDFRVLSDVYNEAGEFETGFIDPNEWLRRERFDLSSSDPLRWTIMPDPDYAGRMQLIVDPYPSTAKTLQFIYQRSARPLRLTGSESASRAGTVAGSAAGLTITGTNTTFDASMVGSFIRIGSASHAPTGYGGDHPYIEQREIVSYTSATSIGIFPALSQAHSGAKYTVSDPVDLWHGTHTAFFRCCERELAISRKTSAAQLERVQVLAKEALMMARERDVSVMAQKVALRGAQRATGDGFTVNTQP